MRVRIFVTIHIKINQQRSHKKVATDFVLAFNYSHQIRKQDEPQNLCTCTPRKFISYRYFLYEVHCNVLSPRTHHRKLLVQLDPAKNTMLRKSLHRVKTLPSPLLNELFHDCYQTFLQ